MKSEIWKFLWAKKKYDGEMKWLSLYQHLTDTWYVCGLLWEHFLSENQKKFIENGSGNISENEAKRLIQFVGSIHDIGKATPVFQVKKGFKNCKELDEELLNKLEKNGFKDISTFSYENERHHTETGEVILLQKGINKGIASIVGGHHGKPFDMEPSMNGYPAHYYQEQNKENEIHKKWKNIHKEILEWALLKSGYKNISELPNMSQPVQVLVAGIIIMADWIASNENYFPLMDLECEYEKDSEKRALNGFKKWLKTECWQSDEIREIDEKYQERFKFHPQEIQKKVFEIIENIEDPGIIIFEAPMGIGKTETALMAVEQLAYKKGTSGLFFGLPTQATSNTMFTRIHKWLESISVEIDLKTSLRLQHGKSELNEEYEELQIKTFCDNKNIYNEFNDGIIINSWMAGRKKAMLDDFVVGTVDQLLLMALKQKHLALRHLGFSKKVVVIDEVHAYDAYMNQYLYRAIHWLGAYNVPVIVLSATLPKEKRKEILKSYMLGKGIKWKECEKDENEILTKAYPLLSYNDGKNIKIFKDFIKLKEKNIQIKKYETNIEENIEEFYEILKTDGIKGIIVNTVKKAQTLAKKIAEKYGENTVELLHSSFISSDRAKKENYLMKIIGKNAKRPKHKIIIGTQLLEQSLDIDFDVLITELAPMDLLLQRMGRLHRHNINRPKEHKNPIAYITGVNEKFEFDEGTKHIYQEYILAKTVKNLPEELIIPKDISKLVQKVYEENKNEKSEQIERFFKTYKQIKENKESKAKNFILKKVERSKLNNKEINLHGWIENSNNIQDGEAQVRDIEERIEIIALKKVNNGYGTFSAKKDISNEISDIKIAKEIAKQTIVLPKIVTFNIEQTIKHLEKLRKNELKTWDTQPWLNSELALIFDENNIVKMGKYILEYNEKYGLEIKKEEVQK